MSETKYKVNRGTLLIVLEVIEQIVGDDDCEDLEIRNATKRFRGDKKKMQEKLSAVYRFAHAYIDTHECFRSHENWRKEALAQRPQKGK